LKPECVIVEATIAAFIIVIVSGTYTISSLNTLL